MPIADAWKALQSMLEGMLEVCRMTESTNILEIMVCSQLIHLMGYSLFPVDAVEPTRSPSIISKQERLHSVVKRGKIQVFNLNPNELKLTLLEVAVVVSAIASLGTPFRVPEVTRRGIISAPFILSSLSGTICRTHSRLKRVARRHTEHACDSKRTSRRD